MRRGRGEAALLVALVACGFGGFVAAAGAEDGYAATVVLKLWLLAEFSLAIVQSACARFPFLVRVVFVLFLVPSD